MYNKDVDWAAFDDDDNSMIELGMELLEAYLHEKDSTPNPDFLRTMFIDEFDGFEDVEGDVKNAIVVKAMERWDELHPDKAKEREEKKALKKGISVDVASGSLPASNVTLSDYAPGELVEVTTRWNGQVQPTTYKGVVIAYEPSPERLIVTFDHFDPSINMLAWIDSVTPDEVISIRKISNTLPMDPKDPIFSDIAEATRLIAEFEASGSGNPSKELLQVLALIQMRGGGYGLDEEDSYDEDISGEGFGESPLSDEEIDAVYDNSYDPDASVADNISSALQAFEDIVDEIVWYRNEIEDEIADTPVARLYEHIGLVLSEAGVPESSVRKDASWTWGVEGGIAATATVVIAWMDDEGLHQEKISATTAC